MMNESSDINWTLLASALDYATPLTKQGRFLYEFIPYFDAILRGDKFIPNPKGEKSLDSTRYLIQLREERLRQAQISFRTAVSALILGILLAFIGIILAFTINLSTGIIIAVSSVVVEVVSALAFKFYGDTNDRFDRLGRELFIVEQTYLSIHHLVHISDPKARDEVIADLIKRLQASVFTSDTKSSLSPSKNTDKPNADKDKV